MAYRGSHAIEQHLTDSGGGASALGPKDVAETVGEFGAASLELIAWEFSLPPSALLSVLANAVSKGLIRVAGICPDTGEQLYELAAQTRERDLELAVCV
jgi:hypothetical protein